MVEICPVCSNIMCKTYDNYYQCKKCEYMLSKETAGAGAEVIGVDAVRIHNFHKICRVLKVYFPAVKSILDVGCSRGLFLEVATQHGFDVVGIEPDIEIYKSTVMRGYKVVNSFFPDSEALAGKKFDAIVFNDSLEHIPNLNSIMVGIKAHLDEFGVTIVNIPTSKGLVFFISSVFRFFGVKILLDRLWQKGFSSPHVHYFNKDNLKLLFEKNGFEMKCFMKLPYYTIKGLWERLTCKSSFIVSIFSWVMMVLFYPLFMIKSDCFVEYFAIKGEKQ